MDVSVIVPVHNERDNLVPLWREVTAALEPLGLSFELIFIDDGSRDGSNDVLRSLVNEDPRVRLLELRRNYGQSAALQAGIDHSSGDIIVLMDGDLQNNPADIPYLLQKLNEGYDLVQGWRRHRQDPYWTRRLPSLVANWLIARLTGVPVRDLGCALKVVRRAVAQDLELYGDMHRFLTILAHEKGARWAEVEVSHRPRQFGRSKYGLSRTLEVLADLITVKYLLHYFDCPMRLLAKWGACCWLLSLVSLAAVLVAKWVSCVDMTGNPLLLLSVMLVLLGAQFFGLGLLAELGARIYFQRHPRRNYTVRARRNFDRQQATHPARSERHAA